MNECVFCGQPIHADQPTAGRPAMAAHATCADAALADDRHWDAVAAASPVDAEAEPDAPPDPGSGSARRGGCLALSALATAAVVVATLAAGRVVTRLSWRR